MRARFVPRAAMAAGLVAFLILRLAPPPANDVAGDAAKVQGFWSSVRWVEDGNEVSPSSTWPLGGRPICFVGDRTTCRSADEMVVFRLDSSSDPGRLHLRRGGGLIGGFGQTMLYRLEGDTLTICSGFTGLGPFTPEAFDSKPGSGQKLRIYRRMKPAADRHADDGAIRGAWESSGAVFGGDPDPPEYLIPIGASPLILEGGKYEWRDPSGKPSLVGGYTLDPTKLPRQIDFILGDGPLKGKALKAIYHIEGNGLIIAYPKFGQPRPAQFSAEAMSGQFVKFYKRPRSSSR